MVTFPPGLGLAFAKTKLLQEFLFDCKLWNHQLGAFSRIIIGKGRCYLQLNMPRPRAWRESERRMEKEIKSVYWHKSEKGQVSAPLIIDSVAGNMTNEMKIVCKNFENVTGMRVEVQTRAGRAIKQLAKSEPLKSKKCGRDDCFPCSTRVGKCDMELDI